MNEQRTGTLWDGRYAGELSVLVPPGTGCRGNPRHPHGPGSGVAAWGGAVYRPYRTGAQPPGGQRGRRAGPAPLLKPGSRWSGCAAAQGQAHQRQAGQGQGTRLGHGLEAQIVEAEHPAVLRVRQH